MNIDRISSQQTNATATNHVNIPPPHRQQEQVTSVAQDLSTGILSVEKTQKILQHEVINKLHEKFKAAGVDLKGLDKNDFTPEKVSDRILSFVDAAVNQATNNGKDPKQVLETATDAINKGFKEARDILDAIGVLNGKVKEDIDKTYSLIQGGLQKMADPDAPAQATVLPMEEAKQAVAKQFDSLQEKQTNVEIFTQEGDKVTINLSSSYQENISQSQTSNKNGISSSYQQSSSFSASIQYSVEGNLNDKEKGAIDNLIKQLNGVAKDFYQGNIGDAFSKAQDLGYNSDQLAKFSVSMQYSETSKSALGAYQQIQQAATQASTKELSQNPVANDSKQLSQFFQKLDKLIQAPAFDFIASPNQTINKLMPNILAANNSNADEAQQTKDSAIVSQMLDSVNKNKSSDSDSVK